MDTPAPSFQHPSRRPGRFAGADLRSSTATPDVETEAPLTTAKALVTTKNSPPSSQHVASSMSSASVRRFSAVPESLYNDPKLLTDMEALPSNYSFELPKTIHRLRQANASRVALQMPEGLLLYATTISDILIHHSPVKSAVILADVTYGACCIDDLSARALSCDFLVHYGHSCLVPLTSTTIPTLYVFVHITFDSSHLQQTLRHNFNSDQKIALVATIQFVDTAHAVRDTLKSEFPHLFVPQKRPLSPGELLGCTAPVIPDADVLVYIGDGRFHLESAMIANPQLPAFRYDPYAKRLTTEKYSTAEMHAYRKAAIEKASKACSFGIILGTLGRQGSSKILHRLMTSITEAQKCFFVVLLSELTPQKLSRMEQSGVEAWVQIACPRLSIDWGHNFSNTPLLTPYECFVALGKVQWRTVYPMDYYAKDGGEWSNYYKEKGMQTSTNPRTATASRSQLDSKSQQP